MRLAPRLTQDWIIALLIGTGVLLTVLVVFLAHGLEDLELKSYDLRFVLRGPAPHAGQAPILIVGIDEESAQRLNMQRRQIPRLDLARAITTLKARGARLIVLDLLLTEPSASTSSGPGADAALAEAMAGAGNVVLARYLSPTGTTAPMPAFQRVEAGEGLINVQTDPDGVLRWFPLLSLDLSGAEPEPFLTLSAEAARLALFSDSPSDLDLSVPDMLVIGPGGTGHTLRIPHPDNRMLIHYAGPPGTFPVVPLWKAVSGDLNQVDVSGKIVLIGGAHPSLFDAYPTPYSRRITTRLAGVGREAIVTGLTKMYGVEVHAHALAMLLSRTFIRRSPAPLVAGLILALGAAHLVLQIVNRKRMLRASLITVGLFLLLVAVAAVLFARFHYWLDVVPLTAVLYAQTIGNLAYQRYLEARQKRQIVGLFGRYVSPQVVQQLVSQPDLVQLGGKKERLTILFSDIRGFTAMSERMDSAAVTRLLNEYFDRMTALIFAHGGTLDKFMGDAILAFFGNPVPQPDHALRAVRTALAMQAAVAELNARWAAEGRPKIGVGVGINTGEVVVGNLGSTRFFDYTVIGDEVNLACRLEEAAPAGQVLVTNSTYREVEGLVEAAALPPITVKGKSQPVAVWQVTGPMQGA